MLWICSIFRSVLTHNWMLLPHFYDGFYFICDLIEWFRSIFSLWSMYPNFVYHEYIYQHIRLSTWTQMYLSTRKIISTDASVFINDYQINLGRQILQLGKDPLVKNTPPILLNVSWGVYSSQYPTFLISQVSLYQWVASIFISPH